MVYWSFHPGCQAQVVVQAPIDLYEPLRRGDVDVLLMRLPAAPEALPAEPGIVLGPVLAVEDRAVAMAQNHPLASRAELGPEDLADHEVIRPAGWPDYLQDLWSPPVTPSGHPIRRAKPPALIHLDEILDMVARSHVLHLTVATLLDTFPRPDLTTVPFTGLPPLNTVLARRTTCAPLSTSS